MSCTRCVISYSCDFRSKPYTFERNTCLYIGHGALICLRYPTWNTKISKVEYYRDEKSNVQLYYFSTKLNSLLSTHNSVPCYFTFRFFKQKFGRFHTWPRKINSPAQEILYLVAHRSHLIQTKWAVNNDIIQCKTCKCYKCNKE